MMMLSGGLTSIESQPAFIHPMTWFLPFRHYMAFTLDVIFRGAALDIVWPLFLIVADLKRISFASSRAMFCRSISVAE